VRWWWTTCAALELDEVVEAAHEDRTLWRHRVFVRTWMGVKYPPATVRAVAEAAIRKVAQSKDNPAELINGVGRAGAAALRAARLHHAGRDGWLDEWWTTRPVTPW
jgi:hypothetical protein